MAAQGCAHAGLCTRAETCYGAERYGAELAKQYPIMDVRSFMEGAGILVVVKSPFARTSDFPYTHGLMCTLYDLL